MTWYRLIMEAVCSMFYILFITYAEAIDFRSWCDSEWTRLTGTTGKDQYLCLLIDFFLFCFFFPTGKSFFCMQETWQYLGLSFSALILMQYES
jgi:hypothetical protein